MGEPAFVPIIHTDNNVLDLLYSYEDPQVVRRTLKVYRHVRNMVIRTVLAQKKKNGDLLPSTPDAETLLNLDENELPVVDPDGILADPTYLQSGKSNRIFYLTTVYDGNKRENYEDSSVYAEHLKQVPTPNHVIVITGNSVRMTSIETPMVFNWVEFGLYV